MKMNGKQLIATLMTLAPLMVTGSRVMAQAPVAAAAQGPIDIQANEQEFAGDEVIAKGNVRVKYKDSVVTAPEAHLMRDPGGNPQKAIFVGHPHLIQGNNKIDAETLTFEVATSRVIAEGHAHSEVLDNGPDTSKKPASTTAGGTEKAPESLGQISSGLGGSKPAGGAPERIVTDADRQEYDRSTGKFLAQGHVHVIHGDINVKADKLQLVYGLDNKPETALFSGGVNATQGKNTTIADNMIYSLSTKRLQATGHVKSTVIQEKKETTAPKKNTVSFDPVGMQSAHAAEITGNEPKEKDETVVITSDTQDFSRETNRMSANGNVRIYYQDMIGAGPAAVLVRNSLNRPERIVFSGRSQISQPTKRWIADHIEMTIADKKVLATGNTKAILLQMPKGGSPSPTPTQANSQLAGGKTPL
jgi:lipopolysaccharide assembly outer membrane protein LptD (OstA)